MPAKSEAQRKFLFAKFGEAWVREHHFDNKGKLPEHANNSPEHAAKVVARRKRKARR